MNPRRVLICEDEPLARETLRDFIANTPGLALAGEAGDGAQALALLHQLAPDVVFMDVQMPVLTGLQVLRAFADAARAEHAPALPAVIFTTAYDQHAVAAFELNAVDYLLKPFSFERFSQAAQRVLAREATAASGALIGALEEGAAAGTDRTPLTRILVRDRGQIFPLAVAEIEFLKADAKYTQIAARGSSFYVRLALAELEQRLPAERFVRVHRNAIVNLDFVEAMKPDDQSQLEIRMRSGATLLANREASKRLRDAAI
jgi:two-component system LytT family response regulator